MTALPRLLYPPVVFCLLISDSFVLLSHSSSDELWGRIIEDSYKMGPYNTFCNRSEPVEEQPEYLLGAPCQQQCSCDITTCGIKLPCCPDMPEKVERSIDSSCLYPIIPDELSSVKSNSFNIPSTHMESRMRMVHGCAEEYIGTTLQEKCLVFRNTTAMEQMIPVVSDTTGIVYVNRFCAECNQEDKVTTFTPYFTCRDSLFRPENWELLAKERTVESQWKLIEDGLCVYVFKPPNNETITETKCFKVDYTSCNQTGSWDHQDPFLDEACGAYELPYQAFFSAYRNFHCVLCNMKQAMTSNEDSIIWKPACAVSFGSQFGSKPLASDSLINLDHAHVPGLNLIETEYENQRCENETATVLDPYMDICRRLHCPLFYVQKDEQCFYAYKSIENIKKQATILFEEVNKTKKLQDPYGNIDDDVLHIVTNDILDKILSAESVTDWKFFQRQPGINGTFDGDFIFQYQWDARGDEELVPKSLRRFFNSDIVSMNLPQTSGLFKAQLITHFHEDEVGAWVKSYNMTFKEVIYTKVFDDVDTGPSVGFLLPFAPKSVPLQMSKILICSRIVLSLSEFSQSDDYIILASGDVIQLTQAYVVTDSGIDLCLDDYIGPVEIKTPQNGAHMQEICVEIICQRRSFGNQRTCKVGEQWTRLMSRVTRKPVVGVCDQVRLKSACSATETSYKHIIIHVGGHDIHKDISPDSFKEKYQSLLDFLKTVGSKLFVSGLLPRRGTDMKIFYKILKDLCLENNAEFIDNHKK